jgi:class 3 adenylate cyclase/ABC-type thiamine transport system ATPase subunit
MRYRFHDYTLDPASRELWHGVQRLALEPKVLQVLLYLLEHCDRLVPKAELLEQCWPETFVSESALTRCLARLRKAVPAPPAAPPIIETRHRQGYRFVAEVTVLAPPLAPAPEDPAQSPAGPPVGPDTLAPPARLSSVPRPVRPTASGAERRQLTVLFCDVVDSTTLAGQLDPEDFREVLRRYHTTCTAVIQRYGGYVAQYLGDGLLVYFGWPQAHDDDARRAVHTGLALVRAVHDLGPGLVQEYGLRLAVRIGMHTGLVVVGAEEEAPLHGQLAVGATPNLAAKLQGLAAPDTVVISAAASALVQGYFLCQPLGDHHLPGAMAPSPLYQVRQASGARGRLDIAAPQQLTPFVGREGELAVLRERMAQVQQGQGQVVLLCGEAGMGKSRLVQVVKAALAADGFTALDYWGSPYAQHTAFHPVSEWLQRHWQLDRDIPVPERLAGLEALGQQAGLELHTSLPLLAALVGLALPEARDPAPQLTPQRQRQRTLETLVALVLGLAAQQPVLLVVEDLHWLDPTTLEWLGLVMDQRPTAPLFTLLTYRPTFLPPWRERAHVTRLMLHRLTPQQAAQMVQWLGGDRLSAAQVRHIVAQTDGVPLFVEEVTKFVLAGQRLQEDASRPASGSTLPEVSIPATLRDALMARLDQLGAAKGTAQLGATLGREFPVALLQAVSPLEEDVVRQDLQQLVEAELLYQRGVGATAGY